MRIAVFASGGGSNFQALIDAQRAGSLTAELVLLVTNRASAGAVQRAGNADIPVAVLAPRSFQTEAAYGDAILSSLDNHGVQFVALAGFLKKIPSKVVKRYEGRMVNIHPSLLPAFGGKGMYGRRVHEAVLEYGARWSGVTVHLVDDSYDTGPVVLQRPVAVEEGDTPETLAARILTYEHQIYPQAIQLFADDRIRRVGRSLTILEHEHI